VTAASISRSERIADHLSGIFGLEGKRAVVMGGAGGLGSECAQALAGAGAEVIVHGRDGDSDSGEQVVERIEDAGGRVVLEIGLIDEVRVRELASRVLEQHGDVDILVNAAGTFTGGEADAVARDDWEATFHDNVTGMFVACREFGRAMIDRGRGKIVNLASADGFVGSPGRATFCASMGAVVQLTRTLGVEWIEHGVNVNGIAPGEFATSAFDDLLDDPERREQITAGIPIGRLGRPEEIRGATVFLASAASEHGRRPHAPGRRWAHGNLDRERKAAMSATHEDPVAHVDVGRAELKPWELPEDWHLEGDSSARGVVVSRSPDARLLRGIWEAQPSTFRFLFDSDETMVVLSGRMTITPDGGEPVELMPGDMAFFAAGTQTVWKVHEPMRKAFHAASTEPQWFPE